MKMSLPGASESTSSSSLPVPYESEDCSQSYTGPNGFESPLDFEHLHMHLGGPERPHFPLFVGQNAEYSYRSPSDTLAGSESPTALKPSQTTGIPQISYSPVPFNSEALAHFETYPVMSPGYAKSSRSEPGGNEVLRSLPNPHPNRQESIYGQSPASTKDEVARLAILSVGSGFESNSFGDRLRIPPWEFSPESLIPNSATENDKVYINEGQSSRFHPAANIDLARIRDHLEDTADQQGIPEGSKSEVPATELVPCPYSSNLCPFNGKERSDGKPSKMRKNSIRGHKKTCRDRPSSPSMENLAQGRVICEKCGETFSLEKDCLRHYSAIHLKTTFPCLMCGTNLNRKDNLKRHLLKIHGVVLQVP